MEIRILILEDSPEDSEIILRTIKKSGLEISRWRRVDTEALFREALATDAPDVVIADYRLPGFDAFKALAIVQAEGLEIPFLVVSSVIEEETAVRMLREGADDYLLKDRLGRIGEAIRYAMERRRLRMNERRAMLVLQQALESERRLREEAEKTNRIRQEFLASLSHELLQPLNIIVGWGEIIARGNLAGEELKKAIKIIQNCAMQQKKLVDDLLDVASTTTGKLSVKSEEVSLQGVLEHEIQNITPAARAKQLDVSLSSSVPNAYVAGDPQRLAQIFSNLLTNAVKFTGPRGRVSVSVDQVGSHFEVAVRDDGEGISAEFLPHVFDRFRQEDQSATRTHGGLGLGLALARDLVELHGGSVRCESPGKGLGTTLVVQLPCLAVRRVPEAAETRADPVPLTGLRVLLVDDNPAVSTLLQKLLEREGADVVCANSAADARVKLDEFLPNILVSDISMPDESGLDLIKSLRHARTSPSLSSLVPAVALTALRDKPTRLDAIAAGFQEILQKPVDSRALVEVIGRLAVG